MSANKKTEKKAVSPINGATVGPGPGRPKGSKNKFTNLKDAFLDTFEKLGGVEGLYAWANKSDRNRGQFYQWITKMLPTNIGVDHTGSIDGKMLVEVVHLKGAEVPGGNGGGNGGNGNKAKDVDVEAYVDGKYGKKAKAE